MMNVLRILDHTGDTSIPWDPNDAEGTAQVKAEFDKLLGAGHVAFAGNADGTNMEVVREFPPQAETIIISRPLVGG